jgi:hypothetical protein
MNAAITNEAISELHNLTSLDLFLNQLITDNGIRGLTNLTHLDLSSNKMISNHGVSGLTNLTSLWLIQNQAITMEGLELCVTNLRITPIFRMRESNEWSICIHSIIAVKLFLMKE